LKVNLIGKSCSFSGRCLKNQVGGHFLLTVKVWLSKKKYGSARLAELIAALELKI
jgi:hypothetical protein